MLLKVALLLGVEVHVNVEFRSLREPPEDQEKQSNVTSIVTYFITPHSLLPWRRWRGFGASDLTALSICLGVGWRAEIHPSAHPVSELQFQVVIGADGRRNTLPGNISCSPARDIQVRALSGAWFESLAIKGLLVCLDVTVLR